MLPKEPKPHKTTATDAPRPQPPPLPASQPPNRWRLRRPERSGHLPRHTTEAGRWPHAQATRTARSPDQTRKGTPYRWSA